MADGSDLSDDLLRNVTVEVKICVGTARSSISDLMCLSKDAVLGLDRAVDDPVELFIGDKMIGTGFLEEAEGDAPGKLVVRIKSVGSHPSANT